MARKKVKPRMAPEDGPHGVDRWSNNGYGILVDGEPVEPLPDTVFGNLDEDSDRTNDIDTIEEK